MATTTFAHPADLGRCRLKSGLAYDVDGYEWAAAAVSLALLPADCARRPNGRVRTPRGASWAFACCGLHLLLVGLFVPSFVLDGRWRCLVLYRTIPYYTVLYRIIIEGLKCHGSRVALVDSAVYMYPVHFVSRSGASCSCPLSIYPTPALRWGKRPT